MNRKMNKKYFWLVWISIGFIAFWCIFQLVSGRMFYNSIMNGNIEMVRFLVSIKPGLVKETNMAGNTGLQWAVYYRRSDIAGFLIDKKSDMLVESGQLEMPFQYAAYFGDLEMVRVFISKGIDLESQPKRPNTTAKGTSLHNAAFGGSVDVVRLLLEKGANPNAISQFDHGITPLHNAVRSKRREENKAECVRLLIGSGADVSLRDVFGDTPYDRAMMFAETWPESDMAEVLRLLEIATEKRAEVR